MRGRNRKTLAVLPLTLTLVAPFPAPCLDDDEQKEEQKEKEEEKRVEARKEADLTVRVNAEAGPIEGAEVYVESTEVGSQKTMSTNANGIAKFARVPYGGVFIQVTGKDLEPAGGDYEITQGRVVIEIPVAKKEEPPKTELPDLPPSSP